MKYECGECHTVFHIAASRVPDAGLNTSCKACGRPITVRKVISESERPFGQAKASQTAAPTVVGRPQPVAPAPVPTIQGASPASVLNVSPPASPGRYISGRASESPPPRPTPSQPATVATAAFVAPILSFDPLADLASFEPVAPTSTPVVRGFTIVRLLGEGGMASVYLATEDASGREVALKLTHPQLASDPKLFKRFLVEIKSIASLSHPNILGVFRYGEDGGRLWLASELATGGTVGDLMDNVGRLPSAVVLVLAAQMLAGLREAHANGITHRDIKPANLLLDAEGVLKIGDFGVAKTVDADKLTATGFLVGTPSYMSPEQASSIPVDTRSDLFAAGIVLYEMLSGRNPFAASEVAGTLLRIVGGQYPPVFEATPDVPSALERVLDRLLEPNRDRRYQTAAEVLEDLRPLLEEVERRHPKLMSQFMADPRKTKTRLDAVQAEIFVAQAKGQIADPAKLGPAALLLYRASMLVPDHPEAERLLREHSADGKLSFGTSQNPQILELERSLEKDPEDPSTLQRLALLYRVQGNYYRAVVYFKRYLKLRPADRQAAIQLSFLTGDGDQPATVLLRPPPRTPVEAARQATSDDGLIEVPGFVALYGKKLVLGALVLTGGLIAVRAFNRSIDEWSVEVETRTAERAKAAAESRARADEIKRKTDKEAERKRLAEERDDREKDAQAAFETALATYRAGSFDRAVAEFDKLLREYELTSHSGPARFYRAKALLEAQRAFNAVDGFSDFMKRHAASPDFPEALMRRGHAHHLSGHPSNAIEDLNRFMRNHPASSLGLEAHLLRGDAFAAMQDRASATADFNHVMNGTGPADPLHQRAKDAVARLGPAPVPK